MKFLLLYIINDSSRVKNFYIPKGFLKGKIYRYIYYYTMYNFVLYFGILSKFSFRYFFIVELWSFNS